MYSTPTKQFLKARVPELAELAERYDTTNPIPIENVELDIFDTMLKHQRYLCLLLERTRQASFGRVGKVWLH